MAVVTAHLIWGANFVVAKLTLQEVPPMTLAFFRFTLALILLSPFLFTEKRKIKIRSEDLPRIFAVGVLMSAINISFFYFGLTRATAISASSLTLTIPLLSVLFGWWFLREKVYVVNVGGIAIGLLGALLIIRLPSFIVGTTINPQTLLGNILIIFASIAWVAGAVLSKQVLKRYSTLDLTFAIFLVGTLSFLIPAINEYLQNPAWPTHVTYLGILGILFISVLSSVSAYFLFEWSVKKLGVIKADLFQYIEPAVAAVLGILILSEELRASFIIGAVLVGLGAYWATIGKIHHKHHKAHRI